MNALLDILACMDWLTPLLRQMGIDMQDGKGHPWHRRRRL